MSSDLIHGSENRACGWFERPFEAPVQVGKGSAREDLDEKTRGVVAKTSKTLLDAESKRAFAHSLVLGLPRRMRCVDLRGWSIADVVLSDFVYEGGENMLGRGVKVC